MNKCCCGKFTCSQDEDFILNDTRHQMLCKVQAYHPFCGSVISHKLAEAQAEIERLKKENERLTGLIDTLRRDINSALALIDDFLARD